MDVPKILNVDDYEPSRYARTKLLRACGFDVREAATGHDALRLAASEDPALVLLDINLPDLNGFEVCRRLKTNAPGLLPVLHLSATFTDPGHRARALDTGADGYLTEPVDPAVLLASINALLRLKRADTALRAAAREWQTTFDAISDGICLLDASGTIVRCNVAFTRFFADAGGLTGCPVETLWCAAPHGDGSRPFTRMLVTRMRETEDVQRGERWFRVTAEPLASAESVTGAVYIVADITAWRELEAQRAELLRREQSARSEAEAASRTKDEFLAMASHELRTPLGSIRYAVHTIQGEWAQDPSMARVKDVVDRQIKHLTRLVDDLLDVAQLTARAIPLRMEVVSIQHVVADALEAMRPTIEVRGHRVEVSAPAEPLPVEGDPTRLVQVLGNLLSNAIKYTPPGGDIRITAAREGAEAIVRVADTGIGMPPDLVPRVFALFTRGDVQRGRPEHGLGVGLTVAHSIVAAHGGRLTAHSAGVGQGSQFVVRLPLRGAGR